MRVPRCFGTTILGLLILALLPGGARADLIIDQQFTDRPNVSYNQANPIFHPFGQSFTPSLDALDFVQLRLGEIATGNNVGGIFEVQIRQGGTATGALLGTSMAETLPAGFGTLADDFGYGFPFGGSPVQFDFAAPVALNPGDLYSIVLVEVSGDAFLAYGTNGGDYAGGNAIPGLPLPGVDFFFQEGIAAVPEPSSLSLLSLGGLALAGWRRWRTRKQATA